MDGHQVGVKTSALEDKCQAFETLLIHASTLNARFGPYVAQVLELALPGLRFYIHEGVQEACAMYVMSRSSTFPRADESPGNQAHSCVALVRKEQRHPHAPDGRRHVLAAHHLHRARN